MPLFTDPNLQKKTATPAPTIGVDTSARTVNHFVTTPTVDEQNEVLLPRGADISRFRKTGTVFDVHNYSSRDVVGRNLSYSVGDDGHVAVTRFADRPPMHPSAAEWHPDTLLHLFDTGDISGWSIGFNPIEYREPSKKDMVDFPGASLIHTQYRVLEYSVAPLPCNEDAITRALQRRGIISKRLADSLASGHFPKLDDVWARKTIVMMPSVQIVSVQSAPTATPSPSVAIVAPVARRVIVLIAPMPAAAPQPKAIDLETVVGDTIAAAQGKLYS